MTLFVILCVVLGVALAKPSVDDEMHVDEVKLSREDMEADEHLKDHQETLKEFDWGMYEDVHDDEGIPADYYQSFMVSEMADILMDSPIEVEEDPVHGRIFCKKCLKKYILCKKICKGLAKLNGHVADLIPCGTTCLQRVSACCFAGWKFPDFSNRGPGFGYGQYRPYIPQQGFGQAGFIPKGSSQAGGIPQQRYRQAGGYPGHGFGEPQGYGSKYRLVPGGRPRGQGQTVPQQQLVTETSVVTTVPRQQYKQLVTETSVVTETVVMTVPQQQYKQQLVTETSVVTVTVVTTVPRQQYKQQLVTETSVVTETVVTTVPQQQYKQQLVTETSVVTVTVVTTVPRQQCKQQLVTETSVVTETLLITVSPSPTRITYSTTTVPSPTLTSEEQSSTKSVFYPSTETVQSVDSPSTETVNETTVQSV